MRRLLSALVVAGALAGLFVSAARAPRATRSHDQAERLRARFEKRHLPVLLHGRTVVISSVYP